MLQLSLLSSLATLLLLLHCAQALDCFTCDETFEKTNTTTNCKENPSKVYISDYCSACVNYTITYKSTNRAMLGCKCADSTRFCSDLEASFKDSTNIAVACRTCKSNLCNSGKKFGVHGVFLVLGIVAYLLLN